MKRRDAVTLCGLSLAGLNSAQSCEKGAPVKSWKPTDRILIIGAGISGLAAAQTLQAAGKNVMVLEARDRIGGRIWTSTRWADIPLDLGASWIHGLQGNPLTRMADKIQAMRISTSYDSAIVYDTSGSPLSEETEDYLTDLRDTLLERLRQAQNSDTDTSVRSIAEQVLTEFDDSDETRCLLNFVLSGTIEQEYAGSAEELSSHWYDSAQSFSGKDALFASGFQQITQHLSAGLQIETSQIVREIHWQVTPLRVVTARDEFTADRVIMTLPLGVLKSGSIQFEPPLPEKKQKAVTALGMGVLNKCYLRFPRVFWPDDVDWLEYVAEEHGHWTEWVSFVRSIGQPVLLGFNAGTRGREIESLTDQQTVDDAMQTLRRLYGEDIPQPMAYQITRWASDRFSYGSYSFNAVGATPHMRNDLGAPLNGVLYFAGEATSVEHYATAHGAYQSGIRAAAEILGRQTKFAD